MERKAEFSLDWRKCLVCADLMSLAVPKGGQLTQIQIQVMVARGSVTVTAVAGGRREAAHLSGGPALI